MPRKPQHAGRLTERFQITFDGSITQERVFLEQWFARPFGRRQAWARTLLGLGLQVGRAVRSSAEFRQYGAAEEAELQTYSVNLTLQRKSPDDELALRSLDRLPYSRRTGWLRQALLDGLVLMQRLPELLATPVVSTVPEAPETITAPVAIHGARLAPLPARPRGNGASLSGRAQQRSTSPDTLAGQTEEAPAADSLTSSNLAPEKENSITVVIAQEILDTRLMISTSAVESVDIDLDFPEDDAIGTTATASGPPDDEVPRPKRPELRSLLQ